MNFTNIPQEELSSYFANINTYLESNFEIQWTKYLDLGVKKVRLISYSKEFLAHVERHMGYVLCDSLDSYDATLVLWQEKDIENFAHIVSDKFNPKKNMRLRLDMFMNKKNNHTRHTISTGLMCWGEADIRIEIDRGIFEARDKVNNQYYYALHSMMPEDVSAFGHLFVHALTHILRTDTSALVHGATVGMNNKGMLFCARSGGGKSTLSVHSLIEGFEYVSDDYLTIEKDNGKVYTYPIYSMTSLSHKMYNTLYSKMKGKFMSNNQTNTKFVFNIAAYHENFRRKYPIELCLFTKITNESKPSVVPCAKGKAMTQFIHSSLEQVGLVNDKVSIIKIYDMLKDLNFYQINLCQNIEENVNCLRDFIVNYDPKVKIDIPENNSIYTDIATGLYTTSTFFELDKMLFTTMNRFSTNIYINLENGVSIKALANAISSYGFVPKDIKENIEADIEHFLAVLKEKSFFKEYRQTDALPIIDEELLIECRGRLSLTAHEENGNVDLLKICEC